ncbi:MAG: DNA-binding protein [Magnetospirillum sp.]|nr:DNA-binding protein [Magnetospirillum sp.]
MTARNLTDMIPDWPIRLRRTEASKYLKDTWGIDRKPSTLSKLAVVGGGPRFMHANRVPLYPVNELDAWASSILTPLKSSTSE